MDGAGKIVALRTVFSTPVEHEIRSPFTFGAVTENGLLYRVEQRVPTFKQNTVNLSLVRNMLQLPTFFR